MIQFKYNWSESFKMQTIQHEKVNLHKKYFPIKLLKSGFMAYVKWLEEPRFGMCHNY